MDMTTTEWPWAIAADLHIWEGLNLTALTNCNHANTISKARGNRHFFFFRVWDAVYSKIFHCQCVVLSEKRGVYSKLATNHQISVCPIFRQSNRSFQLDTRHHLFCCLRSTMNRTRSTWMRLAVRSHYLSPSAPVRTSWAPTMVKSCEMYWNVFNRHRATMAMKLVLGCSWYGGKLS